jgi:hypothetical protein
MRATRGGARPTSREQNPGWRLPQTQPQAKSRARREGRKSAVEVVTSSTAASSSAQSCMFSNSSRTVDSLYLALGHQLGFQKGDDGDRLKPLSSRANAISLNRIRPTRLSRLEVMRHDCTCQHAHLSRPASVIRAYRVRRIRCCNISKFPNL